MYKDEQGGDNSEYLRMLLAYYEVLKRIYESPQHYSHNVDIHPSLFLMPISLN